MLKFRDVTLRRGGRVLFAAANFAVFAGQKVGITGANGTGKSSLFALLRGELHADAGDVDVPAKWIFGHVAQETPAVDQPAIEYVLDGDTELRAIEREHSRRGARRGRRAAGDAARRATITKAGTPPTAAPRSCCMASDSPPRSTPAPCGSFPAAGACV